MKLRNLLLSHAAVFACGAAIVFVARNPDAGRETTTDAPVSARQGSPGADSGGTSVSAESRAVRERRESTDTRSPKGPGEVTARLDQISLIGDPLDRQAALLEFISHLGAGDFATVAEQYRMTEHFGNSRGEFEMILRGWTKIDPLGALEYTSKTLGDRGQTSLVLSAWAVADASAAERWALSNHEGEGPNPYLAAVIQGIAAHDISRASQLAETMPQSHERGEAMEAIARALLVQGAEAAMAYPQTIQDPNLRAGYLAMIADRLANRDAEKAATWLASMNDPEAQRRAAREVAESLARQDVSRAADWVRKLDPTAQAEAARGVIDPMSSSDIAGTAQWVSTLAGIPNYDQVVEQFVWSCDHRDPEQSAAWIRGISDPAQQTRLYHRMLGEWARRDADAVRNWVANNQVPNSVAQRFSR